MGHPAIPEAKANPEKEDQLGFLVDQDLTEKMVLQDLPVEEEIKEKEGSLELKECLVFLVIPEHLGEMVKSEELVDKEIKVIKS